MKKGTNNATFSMGWIGGTALVMGTLLCGQAFSAEVVSTTSDEFKQYGREDAYWVSTVTCSDDKTRVIQKKTDGEDWCVKDVEGFCNSDRDAAAKAACGPELAEVAEVNNAVEKAAQATEAANREQAEAAKKAAEKAQADAAEKERARVAAVERERRAKAQREQQAKAQAEAKKAAESAAQIGIEEELLAIEQEKLELRRQELELQQRAVEIQSKLDSMK